MKKQQNAQKGQIQIASIILKEIDANLASCVYASRDGFVTAQKIDDVFPQQAVRLTIDLDSMQPDDFVVRSVLAGKRRKIEFIAGLESDLAFDRLLRSISGASQIRVDRKRLDFSDGPFIVSVTDSHLVASPKGN